MAHHQKMGADSTSAPPISMITSGGITSHMPSISEDEFAAEADEPPDFKKHTSFTKSRPTLGARRQSLLTAALHEEPESFHNEPEDVLSSFEFARQPSRSSTASTYSHGFTSDDGHTSAGTRASTPSSPPHNLLFKKPMISFGRCPSRSATVPASNDPKKAASPTSESSEPQVEGVLGRKRCISFACGGKKQNASSPKQASTPAPETQPQQQQQPVKKPCMLRFACPGKASSKGLDPKQSNRPVRYLSPAPSALPKASPSPSRTSAKHRDSDTATLKAESPKSSRKSPMQWIVRRPSNDSETIKGETTPFHEFASSEEEPEAWTTMSSCYKNRLTVDDTLSKEIAIRKIGEEVEEEALEEDLDEEDITDSSDEEPTGFSDEDAGFRTDDEDGFADSSDDEAEGHEMYKWWEPRKGRDLSPFVTPGMIQARRRRATSASSINSQESSARGRSPFCKTRRTSKAIPIQQSSDLPDSTDFVCGTLDEDRPLEEAFKASVEQRRLAAHVARPQDLDPSFPTSDPELDTDESDNDDVVEFPTLPEKQSTFVAGKMENTHDAGNRGRKRNDTGNGSPRPTPRRLCSPPPAKRCHRLFDTSPIRKSSTHHQKLTSPPPSRSASPTGEQDPSHLSVNPVFLGQRPQLTHTASLPRSPHPFLRKRPISPPPPTSTASRTNSTRDNSEHEDSDDDGGETLGEDNYGDLNLKYKRGAIDIVQGLERKRLRRRQKFYEKYCRKEKKREERRKPLPGKGAERMKQIGVECAIYRGKRVLSV